MLILIFVGEIVKGMKGLFKKMLLKNGFKIIFFLRLEEVFFSFCIYRFNYDKL